MILLQAERAERLDVREFPDVPSVDMIHEFKLMKMDPGGPQIAGKPWELNPCILLKGLPDHRKHAIWLCLSRGCQRAQNLYTGKEGNFYI